MFNSLEYSVTCARISSVKRSSLPESFSHSTNTRRCCQTFHKALQKFSSKNGYFMVRPPMGRGHGESMYEVCYLWRPVFHTWGWGWAWGMGGGTVPPPSISIIPLKYDSLTLKTHLISLWGGWQMDFHALFIKKLTKFKIPVLVVENLSYSVKVGNLAQPAWPPPPLPVCWDSQKGKKKLVFILHFRLF